ncbi:hypothetical protein CDL60_04560 [Roseateles noduli]|nr:hypothetical protein CDL60_04560 [Roseateles noduli]
MRAHFGGDFTWQVEPWFDRGYLNELELVRLYDLVGDGMETLRSCTSDTSEEWLVEDGSTRFIRGGVPGLYTEMESIVMLDDTGNMWVAYIDDAVVRYFTNVPTDRDKLPEVFESWRQNFREKEVLFSDSTRFASVSLGTTLVETSARPQPLPAPTDQPSNSWWRSIGKLFRRVR